jgi:hypothetical protein
MTRTVTSAPCNEWPPEVPDPAPGSIPIDAAEQERLLQQFELMRDLLRDRVRAVAEGFQTGAYIVGRPGSSKTHTAIEELRRLGLPWAYRNSRMTAAGLFALLQEHPDHAIVLDDLPTLLGDRGCLQMLMAALAGPAGQPRPITYTSKDQRLSVDFRGGIICLSNVPLRRDPLADALQSRVPLLEFEPSDELIAAFMRRCTADGSEDLTPAECAEVVEFVIVESAAADYRLDLRSMTKAFADRRLAKQGKARRPWPELVRSGLKTVLPERGATRQPLTRAETRLREQQLARELFARYPAPSDKPQRVRAWAAATGGKSIDALYRRFREIGGRLSGAAA